MDVCAAVQVLAFAGVRAGHEGLQRYTVELQERIGTLEATMYAAVVCVSLLLVVYWCRSCTQPWV